MHISCQILIQEEKTHLVVVQSGPVVKIGCAYKAKIILDIKLGVQFALDDFGKGYSSLEYLRQLPLGKIKIDRSFVRNLEQNDGDAAIVSAISVLGNRLGLRVLAEGVERSSQLDLLAAEGCNEIQGFYFSPPMEAAKIGHLLVEGSDSISPSRCEN